MTTIAEAVAAIEAAAAAVYGFTTAKLGEDITTFPAVVVGPPTLLPGTMCPGPIDGTASVFLVVDLDEYAMTRLWEHTPVLWAAIEENTAGCVIAANPGTYLAGATELPCYELQIEFPLDGE